MAAPLAVMAYHHMLQLSLSVLVLRHRGFLVRVLRSQMQRFASGCVWMRPWHQEPEQELVCQSTLADPLPADKHMERAAVDCTLVLLNILMDINGC